MITPNQQQIIRRILSPYKPVKLGIFGSRARGDAREDSDLDILVQFGQRINLFDLVRIENELSSMLNIKVDLLTEGALQKSLRPIVEREIIYLSHAEG